MTIKKYITLIFLLFSSVLFAQGCWFNSMMNAMKNGNQELKALLKTDKDGVYAFQKLYEARKVELCKDPTSLKAFIRAKNNAKLKELGVTDELLAQLNGAQNLSYHEVVNNLDIFGKGIAANNVKLEDFKKLFSELFENNAKKDGANWIIKYIGSHSSEFSGKTIKFEEFTKNDYGGRFVDVTDISNQSKKIFYEFKSVAEVPPGHFNEQFIKDLTNANTLDQIKWIFSEAKNPPNFKTNMLNAIDNLPLTDNLAKKLLNNSNATKAILKNELKSKFDNIFKLSN